MREMFSLGVRELVLRRNSTLGIIFGISVVLMIFLSLESITEGVEKSLVGTETEKMMVMQRGQGMVWTSYLSEALEKELEELGVEVIVPELRLMRVVEGNYVLLRGIPLDRYLEVEDFEMIDGEALGEGDEDLLMIGKNVSELSNINVGDGFEIMGESFSVKGVFETGTIADNEIWFDLQKVQELFNSKDFVTTFVVLIDEERKAEIEDELDVQVNNESEQMRSINQGMESLYNLLRLVSVIAATAAILGIMNLMFTVVKQRQRDIAILKSVGFGKREVLSYVVSQSILLSVSGFLVSLIMALIFTKTANIGAMGISIKPVLNLGVLLNAFFLTILIGTLSGAYPAHIASKLNIAEVLRNE
ncbi:MAG: ABC transporter permease [Candidatus Methanofastidiosia archaeon]